MKSLERAHITGLTRKPIAVLGLKTKCTVKVLCSGLMANFTRVTSKTTSVKVTESSPGRTAESTMESGKMENRMAKANTFYHQVYRDAGNGRKDIGRDGLTE